MTVPVSYDALNRVTSKTYPQGGATAVYYGYDLRGLQLSARWGSQAGEGITNVYDGFGRVAASTTDISGLVRTLSYQYDRNGNRTRITHPDGAAFDMGHDGLGRPISIADQIEVRYLVGYAPHGGVIGDIRNNRAQMLYGYGPLYRLGWIAMGHDFPGYIEDLWILLDRNPAGQISSAFRRNDPYVWTGHYAVNRAYATNGLNQYSAAGTASFTYDANGNLISDGTNTFTYDIENRLIARSGGVALGYDPLGRLLAIASPTTYTRFLYDGDALVEEYNGNNALTRRYVHNAGADVPLLSYAGAAISQPSYLHADHQGSIVGVSDPTGVAAPNTYDEYGIPGTNNTGRFQYTGQIWLPELGMYHYKARVYSPTLGRFLQTDPVGYEDQFNLYAYVGNDPVNATDPSGRAIIHWVSNNEVRITINYTFDTTRSPAEANPSAVSDIMSRGLTGTYNFQGEQIRSTTEARYHPPDQTAGVPDLKTVEVHPTGEIPRVAGDALVGGFVPYTPLGGDVARVNSSESPWKIAHEVAIHTSGGADQYPGGRDLNGEVIREGYPGRSLAGGREGNGPRANDRSMGQILTAPTNIVTCSAEATARCRR